MSTTKKKSAAKLEPGDGILGPPSASGVRRITRVDHVTRAERGIVRVWFGKYGLQHLDAAGAYRFEVTS